MTIDVDALKSRNPIEQVIGSYVKLTREGRNLRGACPVHGGDGQNLLVYPEAGTWHCFSKNCDDEGNDVIAFIERMQGLDFKAACEFLGAKDDWTPQIVKPPRPPLPERITSKPPPDAGRPKMAIRGLGEPSRTWEYPDADGELLGFVARYDTAKGKEIRCWSWGTRGNGKPEWGCSHWSKPRPLYGLDRLEARLEAPVLVTEGEKACDAAQALLPGYVCITWPGGAQAWKHTDWTPLRGRLVLLWPDADEPGIEAMAKLAEMLANPEGLACSVRIIDLAGMEPGFDAADWTGTTAELVAWAKPRARDYEPPGPELEPEPQNVTNITESAPAPESENPAPDGDAPEPRRSDDPDPVDRGVPPPEGSLPEPSAGARKRRKKPDLALVDGNTARQPDPAPDPDLPAALTENGSAARFARAHAEDFRVIHEWGGKHGATWLAWDGTRWCKEPSRLTAMQRGKSFAAALRYHEDARTLTELSKQKFDQKKYITSFLDLAQSDALLVAKADLFDADPFLLGTPAGTVDLRAGKLIEPERAHCLTRQTAVAPAEGPHPLFDSVIDRIAAGDTTLRGYIWRALGYSLTGDQREENFWFLYGKAQSGKTTLIEAIAAILGDATEGGYAATCDMDLFTETRHDRGNERMAELAGARFVYASETEEGRNWKAALLKLAVGGDTLRGRMLYENSFSFRPSHHIWIFGNSRPHLKSKDDGIKRRLHLLEYPGVISDEERDNTLKARMVAEYPAILHSMVRACLDWQAEGLGKPESVSHATDTYLSSEDTLQIWLDECCERETGERVTAQAAYISFRRWAEKSGEFVLSQKRFSAAMEDHGIGKARSSSARYFVGLRVKPGDDDRAPGYYQD